MPQALAAQLPILQIVLPLIAAPFCALVGGHRAWAIAFAASVASFAIAMALFFLVLDGSVISYHLGGWAPPIGIEYRVDILNAFVLLIVSGIGALTLLYARVSVAHEIEERRQGLF